MAQQEIKSLTGIRGIAAMMVMFYHFNIQNFLPNFLHPLIQYGYLAVDLFFILSGFVMALTYANLFKGRFSFQSYKTFLMLRIARIYSVYFVAVLICIIVFHFYPEWNNHAVPITNSNITMNLTMTQGWGWGQSYLGPSWSISTEFLAYLLFPLCLIVCLSPSQKMATLTGFFCVMLLSILYWIPADVMDLNKDGGAMNIWNEMTFAPAMRCISEFMLGILTYRIYRSGVINHLINQKFMVGGYVGILGVLLFVKDTDILIIILFPMLILILTNSYSIVSKFCAWSPIYFLGTISYSLYLFHPMTYWVKPDILLFLQNNMITHPHLITLIIQIGLSLGVAIFAFYGIEKPSRSILRKFVARQ